MSTVIKGQSKQELNTRKEHHKNNRNRNILVRWKQGRNPDYENCTITKNIIQIIMNFLSYLNKNIYTFIYTYSIYVWYNGHYPVHIPCYTTHASTIASLLLLSLISLALWLFQLLLISGESYNMIKASVKFFNPEQRVKRQMECTQLLLLTVLRNLAVLIHSEIRVYRYSTGLDPQPLASIIKLDHRNSWTFLTLGFIWGHFEKWNYNVVIEIWAKADAFLNILSKLNLQNGNLIISFVAIIWHWAEDF